MPKKNVSARLPEDLYKRLEEIAAAKGQLLSEVVLEALAKYLDYPVESSVDDRIQRIETDLAELRAKVDRLSVPQIPLELPRTPKIEQKRVSAQNYSSENALEGASSGVGGVFVPTQKQGHSRGRMLTTQQAWEVARERGCGKSKEAFRSWSKRNPADCQRLYQLQVLENSTRDNTLPSYEDVSIHG